MKSRIRGRNEQLHELAQDIKRLARLAYPQFNIEMRERLARECFADALCDPDLEWSIYQGKPNTLDDALQLAMQYETFQLSHRRRSNPKPSVRMQKQVNFSVQNQNKDSESDRVMSDVLGRLARIENSVKSRKATETRSRGPIVCYYCGKSGHFSRDCYQKNKDRNNTNSTCKNGEKSIPNSENNSVQSQTVPLNQN